MNRSVLITTALAGALLIPATALGNVGVEANCERADVTLVKWPAKSQTITLDVLVSGDYVRSGPFTFTGPRATLAVPLAITGTARVEVFASRGTRTWSDSADVSCPTPAPEPQPPAPVPTPPAPPVVPPPVTPPPVIVNINCADLLRVGAGKRWLVKFGCTIPRRPGITCANLRAIGAGPKWYTARGWYPRCEQPRPVPTPHPAVTG